MSDPGPFTSAPDDYRLGETAGPHPITDRAAAADAALALVSQARRSLRIFSHDLDPHLTGNEAFAAAASSFARRNRFTYIRILLEDPRNAMQQRHPMIRLIQGLSSHIGAHRIAQEWCGESFAFIVADNQGLLYRPFADRFEGTIDFAAGPIAVKKRDWFDEVWERSSPEPEFRFLRL